ncbi:MAG: hypothetical protein Greene041662_448 [Candidatus Peregrinibacteria bacterium Greene0416_62]|nr:MAG: hypothetical protein Greene041662_448 [Candidatus Peregrinibacteria bacterium Greene0416_62]TSC99114.1 MAG: hypothetical protein Greene101449_736 [Candidatus Peregrinibacteria bacterium Greene1014_49]
MTGVLEFLADGSDAGFILVRRDGLVEDVILLSLEVHAAEAILQIFAECAELALAAIVAVEKKIAVVIQRRMNALVTQLILEADRMVAAVLVSVRFDAEKTVFASEGVMAAVAVPAFREMISDTVLAAELMNGQVGRFGTKILDTIGNRLSLRGIAQFQRCTSSLIFFF